MNAASQRPTLTQEQLVRYVSRVFECDAAAASEKLQELEQAVKLEPLNTLRALQQAHLSTIPFSNVVLYYSQHHTISLDPDVLFHKIVERGLGGYCVENTGFFALVLRSLGYQFYTGGARVAKSFVPGPGNDDYLGLGHLILIVTINGEKYLIDVGFGPTGPTCPLLLKSGEVQNSITPGDMRLIQRSISANTDGGQKPWVYEFRPTPDGEWAACYCFYETEFLPGDFEVMNFYTSQHSSSIFTQGLICTRFLLNETKDEVIGSLMITKDIVKRNLHGNVEVLETLKNEEERVSMLKTMFNIHLLPMEIRGISGMRVEIRTSE